jgi:nucleoside-diphosphate-sugar epimerase
MDHLHDWQLAPQEVTRHRLIIGCGYLGLRAARMWLARGDRVAALTRSPERAEQLRAEGIEAMVGDVLVPESLAALPEANTLLYAVGYDRRSAASRRELYVNGLANVLSRMSGRARRVIYVSSTSVYGQDDGTWIDETSPCEPAAGNGRVCLEAEHTAQRLAGASSLNILRLAGIYGPNRLLRRVEQLRGGEPLEGRPDAWLNLIHVDDAVAAVMACDERGRTGETYLVCDDQPVPRREYYTALAALVGAPEPQFETAADATEIMPRTAGLNKRCSNRRMREELGVALAFPTYREGLPQALTHSTIDGVG